MRSNNNAGSGDILMPYLSDNILMGNDCPIGHVDRQVPGASYTNYDNYLTYNMTYPVSTSIDLGHCLILSTQYESPGPSGDGGGNYYYSGHNGNDPMVDPDDYMVNPDSGDYHLKVYDGDLYQDAIDNSTTRIHCYSNLLINPTDATSENLDLILDLDDQSRNPTRNDRGAYKYIAP